MWLFWKDIVPFEPGYIAEMSRCWEEVAHLGEKENIEAGTEFSFLMKKRYMGKFAYIRKGCLHSFSLFPDGSERLKLVVDEGSLIYEAYCSAGGCERECWHRAKTNVELICFDGRLLHDPSFQKEYPLLIANVLRSTATKYIMFDALLECMQKKSAMGKVAWYINKLSEVRGNVLRLSPRLSQSEVATLLGISKATMTRVVTELKAEGVIASFRRHTLEIVDRERLVELEDSD